MAPKKRKAPRCSVCNETGHNKRSCPNKDAEEEEDAEEVDSEEMELEASGEEDSSEDSDEVDPSKWFGNFENCGFWGGFCYAMEVDLHGFEAALDRNPGLARVKGVHGCTVLHCVLNCSIGCGDGTCSYRLVRKVIEANPDATKIIVHGDEHPVSCLHLYLDQEDRSGWPCKISIIELLAHTNPSLCLTLGANSGEEHVYSVPLAYANSPEEARVLARCCPEAIPIVLFDISQNDGDVYKQPALEVIREAFRFQTRTLQPKILTAKTQFWMVEEGTELFDDGVLKKFTEDENGKTLLQCFLDYEYENIPKEYTDLLIQCMHSLFHRDPVISTKSPSACLDEMVDNGWVAAHDRQEYEEVYDMTPTKKRKAPRCSVCNEMGHNKRNCPNQDVEEEESEEEESCNEEVNPSKWFVNFDGANFWGSGCFPCVFDADFDGFEAALDRNPGLARMEGRDGVTALHCVLNSKPSPSYRLVRKLLEANPGATRTMVDGRGGRRASCLHLWLDQDRLGHLAVTELLANSCPGMCLTPGCYAITGPIYSVPLAYARTLETVRFLARCCPQSIPIVLFNIFHDEFRQTEKQIVLEMIREAFRFQTRTLEPKILTSRTKYWMVESVDELFRGRAPTKFKEDEQRGKTLLQCFFEAEVPKEGTDLLIQCMYSLFLRDPEISTKHPSVCLNEMVRNGWVELYGEDTGDDDDYCTGDDDDDDDDTGDDDDVYVCELCGESVCSDVLYVCELCGGSVCSKCHDKDGYKEILVCDDCGATRCHDCNKSNERQAFTVCELCGYLHCTKCYFDYFDRCNYCGLVYCNDCFDKGIEHECKQPGELVYAVREAREDDDRASLCACGKRHLSSAKGQQFVCGWVQS